MVCVSWRRSYKWSLPMKEKLESVTALIFKSSTKFISLVIFTFFYSSYPTNMSLCRARWWMMRVWFLSWATPSAQLKRSLRSYRLLQKPRSRSMRPERSTDPVRHDNWPRRQNLNFNFPWSKCSCQAQVQSHETGQLALHNWAETRMLSLQIPVEQISFIMQSLDVKSYNIFFNFTESDIRQDNILI